MQSLRKLVYSLVFDSATRPSSDDPGRLTMFREMWDEILCSSKEEIEAFIQSDLELAGQEGIYEVVAALYHADDGKWEKGEE